MMRLSQQSTPVAARSEKTDYPIQQSHPRRVLGRAGASTSQLHRPVLLFDSPESLTAAVPSERTQSHYQSDWGFHR